MIVNIKILPFFYLSLYKYLDTYIFPILTIKTLVNLPKVGNSIYINNFDIYYHVYITIHIFFVNNLI